MGTSGATSANRQNDIGIDRIATIGKHQAGLCHSQLLIGCAAVDIAGNDRNTVAVHERCLGRIWFNNVIGNFMKQETLDQSRRNGIIGANNDMPFTSA